jgi:hypothetical protein
VQVTFCVFNLAIGQRFASIVLPVSVSFDVEGQRTSRLLRLGPAFDFGRRGGSKKKRVGILESVNDPGFGGVVRRHLHFHPVSDCKPNETLAHLAGNVRENKVIVRKRDAKHSPGQHRHDSAFQLDGFFRIHTVAPGVSFISNVGPEIFRADI